MGKTMDVFTTQISPTLHETRSEIQAGGLRPHFRFLIIDSDSRADRAMDRGHLRRAARPRKDFRSERKLWRALLAGGLRGASSCGQAPL
jgi:hypothetical protein